MLKLKVTLEVKAIEGPELDAEVVLDAFAATAGRGNGALDGAFTFYAYADADDTEPTKYEVSLVDA